MSNEHRVGWRVGAVCALIVSVSSSAMVTGSCAQAFGPTATDAAIPGDSARPTPDATVVVIDAMPQCTEGSVVSCLATCGSMGMSRCTGGVLSACIPPVETCNGEDDDCDTVPDNGFSVSVMSVSYSSDLAAHHVPCNGTNERFGVNCNAAIHRYCGARACSNTGFGPDEANGDAAAISCATGSPQQATYATLSNYLGACRESNQGGDVCRAAIHRYCAAMGMTTGFGPVESNAGVAYFSCFAQATVTITSYSVLKTFNAACNGVAERMGLSCNAAIHKKCIADGFASGFGPLENNADEVHIACLPN